MFLADVLTLLIQSSVSIRRLSRWENKGDVHMHVNILSNAIYIHVCVCVCVCVCVYVCV